MIDLATLQALATALGLGLLVGLQRQRAEKSLAGIRTFPLVTVFGSLCVLLAGHTSPLLIPFGLLALVALMAVENLRRPPSQPDAPSITTEVALLVMYIVGAWLIVGEQALALAITGTMLVLLHAKRPMHAFVRRLGEQDLAAIVQFVVISLIILPLLPNRSYDPYQVLNPFEIWLMVVLIVGLNLLGYVAYRLLNPRSGTLMAGLLGGLISSTATTFSYARQARTAGLAPALAALVIMLASTVVFARILFEIAIVARGQFIAMAPPLLVLLAVNMTVVGGVLLKVRGEPGEAPRFSNPAELKPALVFGMLYALVLLATAAVKTLFGERALYLLAVVSGLTDVDAITLSIARLVDDGRLAAATGWRVITTAALANLGFKIVIAGLLAGSGLLRRILLLAAAGIAAGVLLIGLWPDTLIFND